MKKASAGGAGTCEGIDGEGIAPSSHLYIMICENAVNPINGNILIPPALSVHSLLLKMPESRLTLRNGKA
jgi:hypothetical protein